MSSKIDHKQLQKRLKEDELSVYLKEITDTTKSIYAKYGRQILLGVVLIVLLLTAGYVWKAQTKNAYNQSQILLGNSTNLASQNNEQEAISELNELIDHYPNKPLTPVALMLRGDLYHQTGNYELALEDYKAALPKLDENDAALARLAMVQTYRSLGQYDQALNELQSLEENAKTDAMNNQIHYVKGGIYEDMGDEEKALESYRAIPEDSEWYNQAYERIQWIEAQPAGAINAE